MMAAENQIKMDDKNKSKENESLISRRDALKKAGYAAFASSTMFLLLNNPAKVYAASPPPDPGDDPFPMDKSSNFSTPTKQKNDAWKDNDDPWH
jgi:hypothetical protein